MRIKVNRVLRKGRDVLLFLLIKKGIEVCKGMPGQDSAVKCFKAWSLILCLNATRKKKVLTPIS